MESQMKKVFSNFSDTPLETENPPTSSRPPSAHSREFSFIFSLKGSIYRDSDCTKNNLFPFLFDFLWRLIRLNLESQNGQIQTLKLILSHFEKSYGFFEF